MTKSLQFRDDRGVRGSCCCVACGAECSLRRRMRRVGTALFRSIMALTNLTNRTSLIRAKRATFRI
ncbi:hypothetical protein [Paenibacillus guangzhouensis]|uniref:hypothetical protein n=1 Tax=Paenibacillus guangzhouensis TaxID=1473112 RepID=UPI00187B5119|nr:hypothetical protein [Paenibacillus guangzhouensis]